MGDMPETRLTKEWIEKINSEYLPVAEKNIKDFFKTQNKKECIIKGKKRHQALKGKRVRHFNVNEDEKELIKQFYVDCPKGYSVDHIVPLSKGGMHSLKNLQWITRSLNSKKSDKIIVQSTEFPFCPVDSEKSICNKN